MSKITGLDYIKNLSISKNNYVYYNRLATDFDGKFADIYREKKNELNAIDFRTSSQNWVRTGNFLLSMAKEERKREQEALKKAFGININMRGIPKEKVERQLTQCFNELLSTKNVFQRMLALITQTKGQSSILRQFDYYFLKKFDSNGLVKKIDKTLKNKEVNEKVIQEAVKEHFESIAINAIDFMFTQASEESGIDAKHKKAFMELNNEIQNLLKNKDNYFLSQILNTYFVKDLKENINNILSEYFNNNSNQNQKQIREAVRKIKSNIKTSFKNKQNIFQASGKKAEIDSAILTESSQAIRIGNSNNGLELKVHGLTIGDKEARDDILIVLGTDDAANQIKKYVNSLGTNIKNKISSIEKFSNMLSRIDEGILIHVNAKTYSLNNNFSGYKGFTLNGIKQIEDFINKVGKIDFKMVHTVLQTGSGAIGDSKTYINKIRTILAKYIAQILFDDVDTIGQKSTSDNKIAIHLMYLNYVYVPLSYFLEELGNAALSESRKEVNQYVNVSISSPAILYPTAKSQQEENLSPLEQWNKQREYAESNIRIGFKFFSGIVNFLNNANLLNN